MSQAHVFQLALALQELGRLEALLSGYPKGKLKQMGLDREVAKSFSAPFLAWSVWNRLIPIPAARFGTEPWPKVAHDAWAAKVLPECELFLATSSSGLYTGRKVRARGAFWVCDRPCSHILTQNDLLTEEFRLHGLRWPGIHPKVIERELAEYEESDVVLVASQFASQSFLDRGFDPARLWVVPYGVDLKLFEPEGEPDPDQFTVLFVGQRSLRKGVGDLLAAFDMVRHPRKRLQLVGSETPDSGVAMRGASKVAGVEVMPPAPQSRLRGLMSSADVLVLPSIEDGYGMVVDQAMACGCPCVVSRNAGAADSVQEGVNGLTFEARDVDGMVGALQLLADNRQLRVAMREKARMSAQSKGGWLFYAQQLLDRAAQAHGGGL